MRAGKNSTAIGYAPPVPKLRLVPALEASVLSLAVALTCYSWKFSVPSHSPRPGDYPLSSSDVVLGTLLPAYLFLWVAYSVWRNRRGFRAWGPDRTILCGLRIVLQPVYWLVGMVMLTLIALPACQDCTIRQQNALMVALASNLENPVTERAQANGTLTGSGAGIEVNPDHWITAGCPTICRALSRPAPACDLARLTCVLVSSKSACISWTSGGSRRNTLATTWPRRCSSWSTLTSWAWIRPKYTLSSSRSR